MKTMRQLAEMMTTRRVMVITTITEIITECCLVSITSLSCTEDYNVYVYYVYLFMYYRCIIYVCGCEKKHDECALMH